MKLLKLLWWLFAKFAALPPVTNWLIKKAMKTPYEHLDGYMNRYWLFNKYEYTPGQDEAGYDKRKYKWLPAIRIHHILRKDQGRDLHDHPWDARTIILKGWYGETRMNHYVGDGFVAVQEHWRDPGDTAALKLGEFHEITQVSDGGVWTMFFTWDYQGTWGFFVDGKKVLWKQYLAENKDE